MVAPRHQAGRHRAAAIRTAVYAWLEEISFRTGVTALIVVVVGPALWRMRAAPPVPEQGS